MLNFKSLCKASQLNKTDIRISEKKVKTPKHTHTPITLKKLLLNCLNVFQLQKHLGIL